MHELSESQVDPDPFQQFDVWFREALAAVPVNANAMTLATATPNGRPSARLVLFKAVDSRGFVFYTNYESRKSKEISQNPNVAAVFYWPSLDRQIRIEGKVERVSAQESDEYFAGRPRGSQLSAWASAQSSVIPDRAALETRASEVAERFDGVNVPRPQFWGGFRIRPEVMEFWQGRPDRLHDRIRYVRTSDGAWAIDRLSP